ncbi:tripartite tricarboxylate transporter substrate binding protein [Rhodovulum sulfidophilum]|uniref:tripartite tricarboxylate transporter substrate binding protein n=1 Tax=Rhodovulum sulfidophilum TaxID=35806 RepID=UPI000951D579|nr:tripartite tricarboxylate transporter substrate binding protein [Rhodovulum sulfidophilum]MBL3552216.1 tripartite tricarboxylate transporter substrate binding protein [Rhodovulum sulfidophilum]OLS46953.1 C4-dicarboxylate ABC transporter substrate-binding protein [Rhodovulum sulfidophilum]
MTKFTLYAAAGAIAAALFAAPASAGDFPPGQVEYIIPFGPGGESDITARLQQPYFEKLYGEQMIVSYKPGGGGAVGWSQLNGMAADGSVIMGVNLPHTIIKPLQGNVGFETDDIVNAYIFHYTPDAIVVRADSPYQSLDDLIAAAKETPRKITFSGSGKGTANHLVSVRFDELAGIETTYVSFKGTGAAVTAMLGGQVSAEWGYTTVGGSQGDKVRMLAVAMEERHPAFPDVPTFRELGYDIVSGAYRGVAVPKDTPEETRQAVSDAIAAINADPEFRQKMIDGGFALIDVPYGPEMDAWMKARAEEYIPAARAAGVID